MRHGRQGRLWGFLAGFVIAIGAGPCGAQELEYVITFDDVIVRQPNEVAQTPELAHIEPPFAERLPPSSLLPLAFAPGEGTTNPSFVQQGFLVEAFWAVKTGTPEAYFKRAHFHPSDLSSGFEAQHLGNTNELHGIYIRSLDGRPFGLKSLRYRITRNRQLPTKPLSMEGFSNFSVNVLVARSFDPRRSVRGQFIGFPVGVPIGNDLTLPWWTLRIFGFELVDHVYVASSASVDLDDIVLTRITDPSDGLAPDDDGAAPDQ